MKARSKTGLLAVAITLAASILTIPTHAQASNSQVNSFGTLTYYAAPTETNNLTVELAGADVVLSDPGATITPGTGCAAVTANQVKCTAPPIREFDLQLGDLNDSASIAASIAALPALFPEPVEIEGGGGNDTITGAPGLDSMIFGDDSYFGGTGNDTLTGGSADDELIGHGGNDSLIGGGGDDQITGGDGNDLVDGGSGGDSILEGQVVNGADRLDGGTGENSLSYEGRGARVTINENGVADDGEAGEGDNVVGGFQFISTGDGNDVVSGAGRNMWFSTGDGNDIVSAGNGSDMIYAAGGDDILSGADGADQLVGGDGNDRVDGGAGNDSMFDGSDEVVDAGNDQYRGGPGTDLLDYSTTDPLTVDLDGVADDGRPGENDLAGRGLEDLIGGPKADTLVGNGSANRIDGGPGNDRISGRDGPDGLFGGEGNDQLDGGNGIDVLDGGVGPDLLRSRDPGPDEVRCGSSLDILLADPLDKFAATCDRSSIGPEFRTRKLRFNRRGKAGMRLTCPDLEGIACKVRILVRKGKKTLARGSGKVRSGKTGKVRMKLTRTGRKRRAKRLNVRVTLTFIDAAGDRVRTTRRMRLLKKR